MVFWHIRKRKLISIFLIGKCIIFETKNIYKKKMGNYVDKHLITSEHVEFETLYHCTFKKMYNDK